MHDQILKPQIKSLFAIEKLTLTSENNRKKWLNRLKFWKNRPVRFDFISKKLKKQNRTRQKTGKKTEPNWKNQKNRAKQSQNRKKPSQNQENRAKPVWTGFFPKKPNRNWSVWPGFGFFSTNFFDLIIFFIKTKPNKK
jgi:hypothetical protein